MKKTINILGTEYAIEVHKTSDDKMLEENSWAGYCEGYEKRIVLADFDDEENFEFVDEKDKNVYAKQTLRHEIIHAYLNESGLQDNAGKYTRAWAKNEEMVDWIAIQFPKIMKTYQEVGCL